jgi:predicted nucleic acid-binding protein
VIVISDTSPITSLLQIGRASLLRDLFESVVIPEAVRAELMRTHDSLPDFVRTEQVQNGDRVIELAASLDLGEAQAIVLAEELHADLLLMDETQGRRLAMRRGIKVIGLLAVLVQAKQKGLVAGVTPIIGELRGAAGFYVAEDVVASVLRQAGEA